jgi:hypothetical protein
MKRRQFIELSAGLIPILQAHTLFAQAGCSESSKASAKREEKPHLIRQLRLQTQAPLTELQQFYCGTIGFSLISISGQELTIQAGKTVMIFEATSIALLM